MNRWLRDWMEKFRNWYANRGVTEQPIDSGFVGGFEDFETGFEAFGAISSPQ